MKKIYFLFMMLAMGFASFAQTASVTFNLNMSLEEVAESGVFLAGGADFGVPGDNPMTDDDGDGVYSITVEVNTPYTGNYTFTNGNCGDYSCKENIAGQDCADGTWNDRLLSGISEDTVISTCFSQCTTDGSCFVAENSYEVTFNVNMSNETVAETGVYLAGGVAFGVAGDNQMLDEDGDGTYSITMMLDEGLQSHYTFLNGNCGDWLCKENLADLPCGDEAAYNDRLLPVVTGPTTISTCFGQCSTDGTCEAPSATASVEFNVDMSEYTGDYGMVNLNGTFNGWCGDCNPMSDEDGDGVYTIAMDLDIGASVEYKFTLDGWTAQEEFAGGESCTVTNDGFTNRSLSVTDDEVLSTVCYNSCEACGSAPATVAITFHVDMNDYPGTYGTVNLNGGFNGWCGGCNEMTDADADGVYDITIDLNPEATYEYKFTLDAWTNQEDFAEGSSCTSTIDGFTNRTLTTGTADETLPVVCYNSCDICSAVMVDVLFSIDMTNYAYLLDTDYSAVVVNGSWNGWGAWGVELAYNWNNGRFEGTLNLEEGTSHEFVIAATGEADGWSGWGYVIYAPYQCSPNWVLGGPTENLNYGFIATEGATVEYCAGSCEATCPILGCTDPAYAEFALAATEDDGSCVTPVVYGCIYEAADNYDAEANTDNGNCIFAEEDCAGDLDGDGLIATPDLLSFLSMFGTTCGE